MKKIVITDPVVAEKAIKFFNRIKEKNKILREKMLKRLEESVKRMEEEKESIAPYNKATAYMEKEDEIFSNIIKQHLKNKEDGK